MSLTAPYNRTPLASRILNAHPRADRAQASAFFFPFFTLVQVHVSVNTCAETSFYQAGAQIESFPRLRTGPGIRAENLQRPRSRHNHVNDSSGSSRESSNHQELVTIRGRRPPAVLGIILLPIHSYSELPAGSYCTEFLVRITSRRTVYGA